MTFVGCHGIRTNAAQRLIDFLGNAGAAVYFKCSNGKRNFALNFTVLLGLMAELPLTFKRDLERRTKPFMSGDVLFKGTFLLFLDLTQFERFDNAVCEALYASQYYAPTSCPSFEQETWLTGHGVHFPVITGDCLAEKVQPPVLSLGYVAHRVRVRAARLSGGERCRALKALSPDFTYLLLEAENLALRIVKLQANGGKYPNEVEMDQWLMRFHCIIPK